MMYRLTWYRDGDAIRHESFGQSLPSLARQAMILVDLGYLTDIVITSVNMDEM